MFFSILRFSDKTCSQVLNSQPRMEGSTSPDTVVTKSLLLPTTKAVNSVTKPVWVSERLQPTESRLWLFCSTTNFQSKESWNLLFILRKATSMLLFSMLPSCLRLPNLRNLLSKHGLTCILQCQSNGENNRGVQMHRLRCPRGFSGVPLSGVCVPPRPPEDSPPWSLRSPHHALPQLSRPLHPSLLLITVWSIVFLLTHKCSNSFAGFSHFLP